MGRLPGGHRVTDSGRLAVIPNCQLLHPGWCCSDADCNGLWYNDNWPGSTFTSTWLMVAQRFACGVPELGHWP